MQSLKKQIHSYQEAFVVRRDEEFSINDDHYDFKEKMGEFKVSSENFVNALVEIKRNTLAVLQMWKGDEQWLGGSTKSS